MQRVVLHIEDDPGVLDTVRSIFDDLFPNVRLVSRDNAESATRLFESAVRRGERFDLVIADGNIKGVMGWDVVTTFRSMTKDVLPVLAFSAEITPETLERWHAAGVTEVIKKPSDIHEIVAAITQLLAQGGTS